VPAPPPPRPTAAGGRPRLEITLIRPEAGPVRLDLAMEPEGESRGLLGLDDGGWWLSRVRRRGPRRVLDQHLLPDLRLLDRTTFFAEPDAFTEAHRQDRLGGPNLHPSPLRLPAVMRPGERAPVGPGEVELLAAGRARLQLGRWTEERFVYALQAREGAQARVQWMGEGVGELGLGPPGGPLQRWLVGWAGPGATALRPLPEALRGAPLPDLQAGPGGARPASALLGAPP
jgi:hypothetical protein